MAEPKLKTLQGRFGFADPDLKKPQHDEIIQWIDDNIEDILMVVLETKTRPKMISTTWEPVVMTKEDNGHIIGFMDFYARCSMIDGENCFHEDRRIFFEAKTEIPSLGELFRQLRMYQTGYIGSRAVSNTNMVVVCPDDSNADRIRSQNFQFLKYDSKMEFPPGAV